MGQPSVMTDIPDDPDPIQRPAEVDDNPVKEVERAAFGFRKFRHYGPVTALRRPARSGTPRHHHPDTPLKPEGPYWVGGIGSGGSRARVLVGDVGRRVSTRRRGALRDEISMSGRVR